MLRQIECSKKYDINYDHILKLKFPIRILRLISFHFNDFTIKIICYDEKSIFCEKFKLVLKYTITNL